VTRPWAVSFTHPEKMNWRGTLSVWCAVALTASRRYWAPITMCASYAPDVVLILTSGLSSLLESLMATDVSEFVWDYLKTNTDADVVAIRALLVDGAASVLEAGDVTASLLVNRESTRQDGGDMDLALVLSIQDGGEDPHPHPDKLVQYAVVRVYDRDRGYRNIRAVRQAVQEALRELPGNVGPMGTRGLMELTYTGRTGHRFDTTFAVDYEALTFTGIVVELEAD
jgi:hypothetical protein